MTAEAKTFAWSHPEKEMHLTFYYTAEPTDPGHKITIVKWDTTNNAVSYIPPDAEVEEWIKHYDIPAQIAAALDHQAGEAEGETLDDEVDGASDEDDEGSEDDDMEDC